MLMMSGVTREDGESGSKTGICRSINCTELTFLFGFANYRNTFFNRHIL
jgi:hypothetical protein